jgi:hypothetical protein
LPDVPGTILLTDHGFGGLDAERAALAEIGYQPEKAPDDDEGVTPR